MTGRNQVVQMSIDGPWVAWQYCFPQTGQREMRTTFCRSKRMYVAETPSGKRVVALVTLGNRVGRNAIQRRPGKLRAYWMDAVTGTLYQLKTGMSISSEDMFLWDIRKDDRAIVELINKKFLTPSG